MFFIAREAVYYLNVRQAYLLLPGIAARLSSRTVLFTNVPTEYINEVRLREVFQSINHVWLPTDTKALDELVEDRDKTALKLEGAEVKLSKTANDKRLKAEKKEKKSGKKVSGDFLDQKDRPTHKLGKFGLYGKKVDTVDWCRTHIAEDDTKITNERETHLSGKAKFNSAVFIEFANVQAAQAAYHKTHVKAPKGFIPRASGSTPQEIIWKNLNMGNSQRLIRTLIASAIIFAMIWFWVPITVFIGLVSNLKFLEQKAPFLDFLNKLGPVSGIITNLLPSVALIVALMLVPIIMRGIPVPPFHMSKCHANARYSALQASWCCHRCRSRAQDPDLVFRVPSDPSFPRDDVGCRRNWQYLGHHIESKSSSFSPCDWTSKSFQFLHILHHRVRAFWCSRIILKHRRSGRINSARNVPG